MAPDQPRRGRTRTPGSTTSAATAPRGAAATPSGPSSTVGRTSQELHERITGLGPGDRLYFADWRGDPDEQLTDDPAIDPQRHPGRGGSSAASTCEGCCGAPTGTVSATAPTGTATWARRSARPAGSACGTCGSAPAAPTTRSSSSSGTPRTRPATSPTSAASTSATADATTTTTTATRNRSSSPRPTARPRRGTTSRWRSRARRSTTWRRPSANDGRTAPRSPSTPDACSRAGCTARTCPPEPLGAQAPPPPPRTDGHDVVQIVRTFPVIAPKGFDFAPEGERSVMLSNTKAIAHADRLVYVEDQYLWSEDVGEHFASALRAEPRAPAGGGAADGARPRRRPDRGAAAVRARPRRCGRSSRRAATGSRCSACATRPACRSTCTPRPASSTTAGPASGPTTSTAVRGPATARSPAPSSTTRGDLDEPAPEDAFPRVLLRTLVAEHLGCDADDVPEDPHELFDAMVACAEALDEWYGDGSPDQQSGIRGPTHWAGCRTASCRSPVRWLDAPPGPPQAARTASGSAPSAPSQSGRSAPRTPAPAGGTRAHRRPAHLGPTSVRSAVRPRRSTRSRSGELIMAKKKASTGAWSADPRRRAAAPARTST